MEVAVALAFETKASVEKDKILQVTFRNAITSDFFLTLFWLLSLASNARLISMESSQH